jgi:hypothetical protein
MARMSFLLLVLLALVASTITPTIAVRNILERNTPRTRERQSRTNPTQ